MEYVIIGNSTAGIAAAESIRKLDQAGSITILSDEAFPTYGRPLISYFLLGKTDAAHMNYTLEPDDFYAIIPGNSIQEKAHKRRQIELEGRLAPMEEYARKTKALREIMENAMIKPPAKFERFPLSAIPIATPAEANNAANEAVCTPRAPTTETINRIISTTLTKLPTKLLTDGSIFRFSKIFLTRRLIAPTRRRPMTNTSAAFSNVHPN